MYGYGGSGNRDESENESKFRKTTIKIRRYEDCIGRTLEIEAAIAKKESGVLDIYKFNFCREDIAVFSIFIFSNIRDNSVQNVS